tara:strand:- start:27982 stop:29064 length:1083 start_codon:yes stop_codon:yes gene_type:complete
MMKRFYLIAFCCFNFGLLQGQFTQIPDPAFEQFLINEGYDDVMDGQVLTGNINGIIQFEIVDPVPNITDLTGIEDFDSLEYLAIGLTGLVSLNLSANNNLVDLVCALNPQLEHINFNGADNLINAYIFNNNLLSLDVSSNQQLTTLEAYQNQISIINLGVNHNLNDLVLNENLIIDIDVTGLVNLIGLGCNDNLLTELDLTQNTSLENLFIDSNQLTSLDIRNGNNSLITDFIATNNPDLQCILVDDAAYSTANWPDIDATTTFVETEAACDALSLNDVVLKRDIKVFPNPATSFFILASPYHTIQNVVLYDLQGKQVKTFEQEEVYTPRFDVSELASGVYFITMEVEGRRVVKKLVVKR